MAKFQFKLDPLLLQRRVEEDRCQRELAQSLRQRMILRDQLGTMQHTITQSKGRLSDGLVGALDVDRVLQFARYSGQVTQRAQGMVVKLAGLEKQIDTARQKLLEATRARKALELLRNRRYQEWRGHIERQQDAQQDEIGLQGFIRGTRSRKVDA